jgi:hypothetical protein
VLAAGGVEQVEREEPRKAVEAAGATTDLLSVPGGGADGAVQAVNGDIHPAATFPVDALVADVSPDDYDGLLLPGGAVNPDILRQDADALSFVKAFMGSLLSSPVSGGRAGRRNPRPRTRLVGCPAGSFGARWSSVPSSWSSSPCWSAGGCTPTVPQRASAPTPSRRLQPRRPVPQSSIRQASRPGYSRCR